MNYIFSYLGRAGVRLVLFLGVLAGVTSMAQAQDVDDVNIAPVNSASGFVSNAGDGILKRPHNNRAHRYRLSVSYTANVPTSGTPSLDTNVVRTTEDSGNTIVLTTTQFVVRVRCLADCVGLNFIQGRVETSTATTAAFFVEGFRAVDDMDSNEGALQVGGSFALSIEDGATPFTAMNIAALVTRIGAFSNTSQGNVRGVFSFAQRTTTGTASDGGATIPDNLNPFGDIDTEPPTVTITAEGDAINEVAGTITWTVTFSEEVFDISSGQFFISGGAMLGEPSAMSGTSITIVSTHTHETDSPSAGVMLTLRNDESGRQPIADAANNRVALTNSQSVPFNVQPNATITGTADNATGTITWVVTFTEPVRNLALAQFTAEAGGTFEFSSITDENGMPIADGAFHTTYQVVTTHTHLTDGPGRSIRFDATAGGVTAEDMDGNPARNQIISNMLSIDVAAPDVESISFSALDENNMAITNGGAGTEASPYNNSAHSYQFAIKYTSDPGDPNADAIDHNSIRHGRNIFDNLQYGFEITCADMGNMCMGLTDNLSVTITRDTSDNTVHNITMTGFYDGSGSLQIGGMAFVELSLPGVPNPISRETLLARPISERRFYFNRDTSSGENGGGGMFPSTAFDTTPPTIESIVGTATPGHISWLITFSEPVTSLDVVDFILEPADMGGALVANDSLIDSNGNTITIESTHEMAGTFTLRFDGTIALFTDLASRPNRVPGEFTFTSPAVMVEGPPAPFVPRLESLVAQSGATSRVKTWTATFNQAVTGFVSNHIEDNFTAAGETTISNFSGAGAVYTFTTTTAGSEFGTLTLSLASTATAIMSMGDEPLALELNSPQTMGTTQITQPRLENFTVARPMPANQHMLEWRLTFSEPVTLTSSNITIAGDLANITTATSPTGDGNEWTFTTTTMEEQNGERTIGRLEIMLTGITTTAGSVMVMDRTIASFVGGRTETQVVALVNQNIKQPMQQQSIQYIAALPNLSNRLNRTGRSQSSRQFTASNENMHFKMEASGTNFQYQKSEGGKKMSYSSDNFFKADEYDSLQFWVDTSYIEGEAAGRSSESVYAFLGADIALKENLVIGMLLQIDSTELKTAGTNEFEGRFTSQLETNGVMVGQYLIGKSKRFNLDVESHVAYGTSNAEFNFVSNNLDNINSEFDTSRLLFSSAISRSVDKAENYILTPRLEYVYYIDEQDAYRATEMVTVAKNKLELNRLELSVNAKTEIEYKSFKLAPSLTISGSIDSVDGDSRQTGTIEGGFTFEGESGISWQLGAHYDIITDNKNLETTGISGSLAIKF